MNNTNKIIKDLRKSFDMSQAELGRKVGVGKTTISNWETGYSSPDPDSLVKLSNIFNCSVDYLLCRTDDKKNTSLDKNNDELYKVADEILEIGKKLNIQEITVLKEIFESGYTIYDLKKALVILQQFAEVEASKKKD